MKFLGFLFLILPLSAFAAHKVAVVKLLRGEVNATSGLKTRALKLDDWVEEGSLIKTSAKSFVKLIFSDKSQMNIGPQSEMKIEKFNGKEAGVLDLVKGKVRSQVTKDYLQIQDQDKSKLFIKTQNAVMGVRGTDFMVSTNGKNTATVLFEGEVVFNHFTEKDIRDSSALEDIVDRGVRIMPGEFSVVEADRRGPTVPSVLNVKQREALEANTTFDSGRTPDNAATEAPKSVVPEGLSGQTVSNTSSTLQKEVSQVATPAPMNDVSSGNAVGFVSGDAVKPTNGSFLHLDSGTVIPPSKDSVFDSNTNSFIPGPGNGTVSADGNFVPPENVEITSDGKILMTVPSSQGEVKVVEISKPAAVINSTSLTLSQINQVISSNPSVIQTSGPVAINQPAPVTTLPPTSIAPPVTGGIDLNTAVIQRTNGRLSIDVIK
jgi:hypothetical protein